MNTEIVENIHMIVIYVTQYKLLTKHFIVLLNIN